MGKRNCKNNSIEDPSFTELFNSNNLLNVICTLKRARMLSLNGKALGLVERVETGERGGNKLNENY